MPSGGAGACWEENWIPRSGVKDAIQALMRAICLLQAAFEACATREARMEYLARAERENLWAPQLEAWAAREQAIREDRVR